MEFIERSGLEREYLDITGTTCKFCESPIFVNDTFTVVKCSNPYCLRKVAGQVQSIISSTGVKGYGIETILKMIRAYSYGKVTDFLISPPPELEEFILPLIEDSNTLTLAIQLISLPNFDVLASRMFDGFNCYSAFLDKVDSHYEGFLASICVEYYGTGVQSDNVLRVLNDYEDDLLNIDLIFDFSNEVNQAIQSNYVVCISGEVNSQILQKHYNGKITKSVAIKILNTLFNDKGIKFTFSKGLTNSVDYLLYDEGGSTEKSRKATQRGICMTTDQFIHAIVKSLKGGTDENV